MEKTTFCQSCGMPMEGAAWGTEADGSQSADYCSYCYENGAFTSESTMQEMIDFCAPHMATEERTEAEARAMMQEFFPTLKRWKTA